MNDTRYARQAMATVTRETGRQYPQVYKTLEGAPAEAQIAFNRMVNDLSNSIARRERNLARRFLSRTVR